MTTNPALQMSHDPIGDDRSHIRVGVVDALPAAELQSESDRAGDVARVSGAELLIVGHGRTISGRMRTEKEQKNPAREGAARGVKPAR
jgi:hypothetical protein